MGRIKFGHPENWEGWHKKNDQYAQLNGSLVLIHSFGCSCRYSLLAESRNWLGIPISSSFQFFHLLKKSSSSIIFQIDSHKFP
jgi:hypothetical protein